MRTLSPVVLLCACLYAFGAAPPTRAEDSATGSPSFRAVMVDEDFFSAGSSAELDKRVDGDAFLSGGRVAVRGPVKGDAVLAGGDVNVADTVGQDLYAAGGSIALSAQVVGNARIAGGQVTISPRGGIAGKAIIAAGSLQMSGRVGHYLVVYAQSVRIDGEVGGDLRVTARSIEIGPDAKITGKLEYRSPQPAKIDPHAVIAGGVVHNEIKEQAGAFARAACWISLALVMMGLVLVGVLLIVAFPRFSTAAAATVRSHPLVSLAVGFALLLCVPVAAVLFLITVIGGPLGLLLLFFYPVMLLLGYLTGALFVGDLVMGWWARRRARTLTPAMRSGALALALLLLLAATKVPLAGGLVVMTLLMLGLGGFWIEIYRGYARPREPSPPRADMQVV
jgi:cytoskeletal protein CcmA (bactofilin family)